MSGAKSGVAKQITDIKPRALFTCCYGHALNLAASDTLKKSKIMRGTRNYTQEITKLIKYSTRREGIFQKLKESVSTDKTPGVRVLCPTRRTVREDLLASVLLIMKLYRRHGKKLSL